LFIIYLFGLFISSWFKFETCFQVSRLLK
jgi:hypothetical protein